MEPLWKPDTSRIENALITQFQRNLSSKLGETLSDYQDLHRWSIDHIEVFWAEVWEFTQIRYSQNYQHILTNPDQFPGCEWFTGARLNFAENLLRYRDDRTAIVSVLENGDRSAITYAELYDQVSILAGFMRSLGITAGDRVAAFMPNVLESVVGMLAATSIGAVWSSCSPDFGVNGAVDRLGQIEPKLLIACDGYHYNGKQHQSLDRVQQISTAIPSLEHVLIVPVLDRTLDSQAIIPLLPRAYVWAEVFKGKEPQPLEFAQLPFDHPLYVLFSSGTTGAPKCIVHGAGGTLLQHAKEFYLHFDISREDVFFYFTTCGWMMWNLMVSSLLTGCKLVLYDGSPFYPSATVLIDLIDQEELTVFGVSAKYIAALQKHGINAAQTHQLASLKTIMSTGSPLSHESFRYVYQSIKADVCLSSISGGTDIVSAFVEGNPTLPVYEGELQCIGLGMAVEIWDDTGHAITQEKGELVCTKPFPCTPLGFWNDPDNSRYRKAYFSRFPGVWAQGDYGEITDHGGMIIYGRSDAVLNPGGVRIGTAEIYRQVEGFEEIVDSVCIGQEWNDDVRVVLFVVMREGTDLTDELQQEIRTQIRQNTTPRHVPAKIIAVAEIPRTKSGKIVELAVRDAVHGREIKNTDAIANPEALVLFRDLPELQ